MARERFSIPLLPLLFLLLLHVLPPSTISAGPLPSVPPPSVPGAETLLRTETLVYSERADTSEIERLLAGARREFQSISEKPLRAYWDARAILLLGSHLNQQGDNRGAARVLPEGLECIEEALKPGEFSDGLRILADLHAQMTLARGAFHMMRHGRTARDAAARARQLDPENVRALITVAGFYLNAPSMFGGDTRTGIARLEQALEMKPQDRNDLFMIKGWLAEAYHSLGETERAHAYARDALAIYPGSRWLRTVTDQF